MRRSKWWQNHGWTNPQWNKTLKKKKKKKKTFIWSSNLVLALRESQWKPMMHQHWSQSRSWNERSLKTRERGTNPGFVLLLVKKANLSCRDLSWGVLSLQAPEAELSPEPRPRRAACWRDAVPTGLCQWHTDRQDYSSSLQDK